MAAANPTIALSVDVELLRPVIDAAVEAALARLEAARSTFPNKLAFPEREAAAMISMQPHVLRDERRRGRIVGSRLAGRRVYYTHDDLVRYLMRARTDAEIGGEA